MRHSNSGKKLGRTPSHRKALFRNMASAMITYGKIRTTEVKAKELRRVVEPLITLALRNDLHSRRLERPQARAASFRRGRSPVRRRPRRLHPDHQDGASP